MKLTFPQHRSRGYVSMVIVISTMTLLMTLMLYAYKRSLSSQNSQKQVQLKIDYNEKEEAMLRYIVATTPNRAIRAMQTGSNTAATSSALTWNSIFTESLTAGNTRQSISAALRTTINAPTARMGNSGDATTATNIATIFKAVNSEAGTISTGLNRSLGAGYPVPLNCSDATTTGRDVTYPIISSKKVYGALAQGSVGRSTATYPNFNVLTYPNINFGYGTPGQPFVAKRNWWAFDLNLAANDSAATAIRTSPRRFVLSIYEVPSQLAISAASFVSLGQYGSGQAWGTSVNIEGNVFAGKANVEGGVALPGLASRRGAALSSGTRVGGQALTGNVFTPGVRENYQVTTGNFFPVSQASESGKVAFVPINRGMDFFNAYAHPVTSWNGTSATPTNVESSETNSISPQTWNTYSVGALQTAMRADVVRCLDTGSTSTHTGITRLQFQFLDPNGVSKSIWLPTQGTLYEGTLADAGFPSTAVASEGGSYPLGTGRYDVAYGVSGKYYIQYNVTGSIVFDNTTFGDSNYGFTKFGYVRPAAPAVVSGTLLRREIRTDLYKQCVMIYPKRLPAFLSSVGGAPVTGTGAYLNNSIAVNVNSNNRALGNTYPPAVSAVPSDEQYATVLDDCDNLSAFTKGFSLVTNFRLYIADDFNNEAITAPTGYGGTLPYYPPCSLFAPEKRYGLLVDPLAVELTGQVGSVANDTDAMVRPLDSKNRSGNAMTSSQLKINLRPITDPADLPPITMMNWLILLEEKTNQF